MERFEPANYPGPRPRGPVRVHTGRAEPLEVTGDPADPVEPAPRTTLHWSVAYGSNACPARLMSKGLDAYGAVLLPARLTGWIPAFEQRTTTYGAIPLTLVPEPGAVVDTWVLGLPSKALPLLDATEGRRPADRPTPTTARPADGHIAPPGSYQLAEVGGVIVAGCYELERTPAYVPGPATRVQVDDTGAWRTWPDVGQDEARAHVAGGGPSRPAPAVAAPIVGEWPATPLQAHSGRNIAGCSRVADPRR